MINSVQVSTEMVQSKARRLNFNMPENCYLQFEALASRTNRTITDAISLALGLAQVAMVEAEKGNKLGILSSKNEPLHELILPSQKKPYKK